ncbi:trigger factor [Thioalkalivibrio paradoxus]|uniref:Trigger factor n=1 Tax=Thioalkalivibrio paradoxus ARh 1 TaxID=713585 RepID=W0DPB1_9GAMM|nr:trigger factor [Thioalkalivibrio paradoxus]AHE99092.1 trigger factor [Thioalkalivibrio paradoxus ARh 1]
MQVSVEATGSLDRRMTVQLPREQVDSEVEKRLKALTRRVRIDGFRPGKVPLKIVQQRYGSGVFQEVLSEMLQRSYREAIDQEGLAPAGGPSIEPRVLEPGQPIEYVASFQVFPEVTVADLSDVEIERPVAEVEAENVDKVIESLRRQQRKWHAVERPAADGDRVTLDFTGTLNGEAFDGGRAEGFAVEVGAGRLLPDFESQLVGLEAGAEKDIDVTFPEDYPAENLKGQTVQFALKIQKVEEPRLPDVDADFARSFGVEDGDVAKLREEVKANLTRELAQNIKGRVKKQVMDALVARHDFELPKSLVQAEVDRLRTEAEKRFGGPEKSQPLPDAMFEDEAARRVRLGLVVRAIVDAEKMEIDRSRLDAELDTLAQTYEDPEEVKRHYRTHPQAMAGLESLVLEDQVVAWVLEQARVTEKPNTFEGLMAPSQPNLESAA